MTIATRLHPAEKRGKMAVGEVLGMLCIRDTGGVRSRRFRPRRANAFFFPRPSGMEGTARFSINKRFPIGVSMRRQTDLIARSCGEGFLGTGALCGGKLPAHFVHDDLRREGLQTKSKRCVGRSRATREMSAPTLSTVGHLGILQDRHAVRALQHRDVAVVTMSADRGGAPTGNRSGAEERDRLDADRGRHMGCRGVDADVERGPAKQGARAAERISSVLTTTTLFSTSEKRAITRLG